MLISFAKACVLANVPIQWGKIARNWDDDKNDLNRASHRLSFETAWLVFDYSFAVTAEDFIDDNGEMRYQTLGLVGGLLILVAHVYRVIEGTEQPWLISARKADKYEKKEYWSNQRRS